MMKKILFVVAIGAAAVAAEANTVSYTNTIPSTLTDWNQNVGLTQFNPALGTLISISAVQYGSFSTVLGVTNSDGSSSSTGSAKTEVSYIFNDTNGDNGLFEEGYGLQTNLDLLTSPFGYSLSAGQGVASGTLTKSGNLKNLDDTDSSLLSEFTGTGVIDENFYTFTATDLSNTGGNTSSSQVTSAASTIIITYDYSPAPAPEPSTFAMIGSGLAGLGLVFRRRSSK